MDEMRSPDLERPAASRRRTARTMLRFAWEADPARSLVALGLFSVQAITASLFAWWLKLLLDGLADGNTGTVWCAAVAIAASVAAEVGLGYAGSRVRQALNERAHHLVEQRLMTVVGCTPTLEIHETPEHLTQLELLDSQSWEFGETIPSLIDLLNAAIRIVLTAVLLVSVHPLLLLLPLFGLPMLLLSGKTNGLFELGHELAAEPERRSHDLWDLATTSGAAKEIRLFRLGPEILRRFHREHQEIRRIHTRVQLRGRLIGLGTRLVFLLGYLGAIAFVIRLAVRGEKTVGDVLLTAVLAGQVLGLVGGSADRLQWALRTLTASSRFVYLERIAERARRRVRAAGTDGAPVVPSRLVDGIRLEGVCYRYPHRTEDTLHDVDLHLPAASTVAVVGDNGAGKTTLVKLLAGLDVPTSGRITVDGTDLAELDPDVWRLRVSAGFQDHARFEFLAQETVGIGDLTALADEAEVRAAMQRAGSADLIDALPQGLRTPLGPQWPGGIDLSGGQWQKLAIGRAMMRRRPLLLLLDEPTAALDAETEHLLFERWTAAAHEVRDLTGAITILVSHRFSTVRMADLIVVVDDGRIAECGTHDELIARGGLYAELFEMQAGAYR